MDFLSFKSLLTYNYPHRFQFCENCRVRINDSHFNDGTDLFAIFYDEGVCMTSSIQINRSHLSTAAAQFIDYSLLTPDFVIKTIDLMLTQITILSQQIKIDGMRWRKNQLDKDFAHD